MDLTVIFLIGIAMIIVLLGVLAVGALISYRQRDSTNDTESRAQAEERGRKAVQESADRREFFKSTGHGSGQEVKLRLYSPEEYSEELGGETLPDDMVAAVKAYRRLEDTWLEIPPRQAVRALELADEDYDVDGERGVLLLKKMPPGMPFSVSGF